MTAQKNIAAASAIMLDFARRTGLDPGRPPRRYLWTDAFAVCNFLGLARATGERRYTDLALRLVDQVHHVLGRHRPGDSRQGWLSGLDEAEGEHHPTLGGLRIGKDLPERKPGEPFDEQLEWERDGQYFHYLTKWMHALDQAARATGEPRYNRWARELAGAACDAFTWQPAGGGPPRMYWKMSIDLARPLVPSMGQHDPLDGYVTLLQLEATAKALGLPDRSQDLPAAVDRLAAMVSRGELATTDPLGIGGLLTDACRLGQLMKPGDAEKSTLLGRILDASIQGLRYYAASGELEAPAAYRLAFRELGLAIGLHGVERMGKAPLDSRNGARRQALLRLLSLAGAVESFWRDPAHRQASTWLEHLDINEVMLATSLAPGGFLLLQPPPASG